MRPHGMGYTAIRSTHVPNNQGETESLILEEVNLKARHGVTGVLPRAHVAMTHRQLYDSRFHAAKPESAVKAATSHRKA
jgi:hypothetical protein